MSCSRITNDYDGITHDYTRKQGLIYEKVYLPGNAPEAWFDRSVLWNAVEGAEKTKDSRLAREFIVALPKEFALHNQIWQVEDFVKVLTKDGMCADVCIHDTDGHNPHAHIMVTIRPLGKNGTWQRKTEKEYLCIRNGEEKGFTSAEFRIAQTEGWEKQYLYKIGKKKEYLPSSKAKDLERVNKYPKSSRYGRQNPISERWNSEEQLNEWRKLWANIVNRDLDIIESDQRVNHRSFAVRGILSQPTVHEGVRTKAVKKKNTHIRLDRIWLNCQIREDNQLLRDLTDTVKYLAKAVKLLIPRMADKLEGLRIDMIILDYRRKTIREEKRKVQSNLAYTKRELDRYGQLDIQIRDKQAELDAAIKERGGTFFLFLGKRKEIEAKIQTLTEELEEMKYEQKCIAEIHLDCTPGTLDRAHKAIAKYTEKDTALAEQEQKVSNRFDGQLEVYRKIETDCAELDQDKINAERLRLRPEKEQGAKDSLTRQYGGLDRKRFHESTDTVSALIGDAKQVEKTFEEYVERMRKGTAVMNNNNRPVTVPVKRETERDER